MAERRLSSVPLRVIVGAKDHAVVATCWHDQGTSFVFTFTLFGRLLEARVPARSLDDFWAGAAVPFGDRGIQGGIRIDYTHSSIGEPE